MFFNRDYYRNYQRRKGFCLGKNSRLAFPDGSAKYAGLPESRSARVFRERCPDSLRNKRHGARLAEGKRQGDDRACVPWDYLPAGYGPVYYGGASMTSQHPNGHKRAVRLPALVPGQPVTIPLEL